MHYIIFLINLYLCLPCDSRRIISDQNKELIVRGKDASKYQFPFAAALHYDKDFRCTSTIISPTILLTAGHCVVQEFEAEKLDVKLFHAVLNFNRSAPEVTIKFSEIILHSNYDPMNLDNDIALLKTTSVIPMDDENKLRSICLAGENYTPRKSTTAIGWGRTNEYRNSHPEILQHAEFEILDNRYCRLGDGNEDRICAIGVERGSGACYGDSGGPLIYSDDTPVEVGIVSYGPRGCQNPLVFVKVSKYMAFIKENANNDSICFKMPTQTS